MQQLRREQVQHAYNGARPSFALQGCEVVRAVEAAAAVVAQAIAAVAVGEARGVKLGNRETVLFLGVRGRRS
jgi:hypothetical protein